MMFLNNHPLDMDTSQLKRILMFKRYLCFALLLPLFVVQNLKAQDHKHEHKHIPGKP